MGRRVTPPPYYMGTETYEVLAFRNNVRTDIYEQLLMLACNSVKINGLPAHIPEWYVKQRLFCEGQVGFFGVPLSDQSTVNAYMASAGGGLDIYGLPLLWRLTAANGVDFAVPADDPNIAIIRANATKKKLSNTLNMYACRIADCEVAISVNLINTQSTGILRVDDAKKVTTLKAAAQQRMIGLPVIYADKDTATALGESTTEYAHNSSEFYADRIAQLRDTYKQQALAIVGVLTANRGKKERVQSAEVNAGVGEVLDYIYTLIDQFNYDAGRQGLPYSMEINTTAPDLYTDGEFNADV